MLDPKEILKYNKELIVLHKKCITTYLSLKGIKWSTRCKFFKLYDMKISEKTIRRYYNLHIPIFVKALVRNDLDNVSYYTDKERSKKCVMMKIRKRPK